MRVVVGVVEEGSSLNLFFMFIWHTLALRINFGVGPNFFSSQESRSLSIPQVFFEQSLFLSVS